MWSVFQIGSLMVDWLIFGGWGLSAIGRLGAHWALVKGFAGLFGDLVAGLLGDIPALLSWNILAFLLGDLLALLFWNLCA